MNYTSGENMLSCYILGSCFFLVYASRTAVANNGHGTRGPQCERLTSSICRNHVQNNFTMMPNFVGHYAQSDARLQLETFTPLIQYGCSEYLKTLLCSAYFPVCIAGPVVRGIGPCKSLCEDVQVRCQPVLHEFGFIWPEQLRCDKFPEKTIPGIDCVSVVKEIPPVKCVPFTSDICSGHVDYSLSVRSEFVSRFPKDEEMYKFMIIAGCSHYIRQFICAVNFPVCHTQLGVTSSIGPCRRLCERAKKGCEMLIRFGGLKWPEFLKCDQFPDESGTELCMAPATVGTTVTTLVPKQKINDRTTRRPRTKKSKIRFTKFIGQFRKSLKAIINALKSIDESL